MNLSIYGRHFFRHASPVWLFALLGCWLALAGPARGAPSVGGVLVETQIEQVYGRSGVPLGDWSPDGRWYAQPGVANDIEVWDNWIGQLTRHITGHTGELKRVCFSPDGTQLITIAADNTLRRWDFAAGTELARINTASTPLALDVNATGTLAVTAEASGAVNIWSLTSNTLLTTATTLSEIPKSPLIWGLKFSPGSKLIYTGYKDNRYLDWNTHQLVYDTNLGNYSLGRGFGMNDNQLFLRLGIYDLNRQKLWCSKDWYADSYPYPYERYLSDGFCNPRTNQVIAQAWYQFEPGDAMQLQIHIYDFSSTQSQRTLVCPLNGFMDQIKISSDDTLLMASSEDGHIYTWDLRSGNLIRDTRTRNQWGTRCLQTSADGKWIAAGYGCGEILLWDAITGEEKHRWSMAVPYGAYWDFNPIFSLRFSRDSHYLAASNWNGQVQVYNTETGAIEQTIALAGGRSDPIVDVDFTPANKLIALGGSKFWVIDFLTGNSRSFDLGGYRIRALDENRVLLRTQTDLREYNWVTGETIKQLSMWSRQLSVNPFIMDFGSDPNLILSRTSDFQQILRIDWSQPAYSLEFSESDPYEIWDLRVSPDSSMFLLCNIPWTGDYYSIALQLYSIASGKLLRYYQLPNRNSIGCAFSADGSRVLGSTNGQVYAFTTLRPNASEGWSLYQ